MRTAVYIEAGALQVVLTPETPEEQAVLRLVESKEAVQMYRGSFYACRGGWYRHETHSQWDGHRDDVSLILVLKDKALTP